MFATIRRHQKWLWFIVIVGVIVPFVWFMGPTSMMQGGGGARGSANYGSINGEPTTAEQFRQANLEVRLAFALTGRGNPDDDAILQQIPERLFIHYKLRQLGIRITNDGAVDWIANFFRDPQRGNAFSKERYDAFVQRDLKTLGISEPAFIEFARHEAGISHLASLASLTGILMPPREAEALFRRDNEQVTAQLALFPLTNHLTEVVVTTNELNAFYTTNAPRYRVPEMVSVSYVRFASSNHLAEAAKDLSSITNLELILDRVYRQREANSFRGPDGKPLTPEAAKEQIKAEELRNIAAQYAYKDAAAIAESLLYLSEQQPGQPHLLESVAASNKLTVTVTPPFPEFSRPAGLAVGADFARTAFALTTNQSIATEPLVGQDGVYLIALQNRAESYLPPLAERENVVAADYRRSEALRIAQEKAAKFHSALTNGLAQGQTFDAVCAANNVTPIRPPAFSRTTQSLPGLSEQLDFQQLKQIALDLPVAGVSQAEASSDGALIVQVTARQPVSPERIKAELQGYAQSLRNEQRQNALVEWFRQEQSMARIDFPLLDDRQNRRPSP